MTKSQNTKNEQLTEQFNHGSLPDDRLYYYRFKGDSNVKITTQYGLYCEEADNKKEIEVIDFVPSYSEYLALQSDSLAKNEAVEINAELEHRLAMVKANGNYPDRISRLKSRVVALSEENQKLKEILERHKKATAKAQIRSCDLEIINAQLKELLKECESSIQYYQETYGAMDLDTYTLLAKLKEALK